MNVIDREAEKQLTVQFNKESNQKTHFVDLPNSQMNFKDEDVGYIISGKGDVELQQP